MLLATTLHWVPSGDSSVLFNWGPKQHDSLQNTMTDSSVSIWGGGDDFNFKVPYCIPILKYLNNKLIKPKLHEANTSNFLNV